MKKRDAEMCLREFLKQLRKKHDLTQEQLADKMGVDRSYIAQAETSCKVPSQLKERYSKHFNLPYELFTVRPRMNERFFEILSKLIQIDKMGDEEAIDLLSQQIDLILSRRTPEKD